MSGLFFFCTSYKTGNKKNNLTIIYTPHGNVKVRVCALRQGRAHGRKRAIWLWVLFVSTMTGK